MIEGSVYNFGEDKNLWPSHKLILVIFLFFLDYFSVETKYTIAHKTKKQVYYNLEPSLSDFYNQSYVEKNQIKCISDHLSK